MIPRTKRHLDDPQAKVAALRSTTTGDDLPNKDSMSVTLCASVFLQRPENPAKGPSIT